MRPAATSSAAWLTVLLCFVGVPACADDRSDTPAHRLGATPLGAQYSGAYYPFCLDDPRTARADHSEDWECKKGQRITHMYFELFEETNAAEDVVTYRTQGVPWVFRVNHDRAQADARFAASELTYELNTNGENFTWGYVPISKLCAIPNAANLDTLVAAVEVDNLRALFSLRPSFWDPVKRHERDGSCWWEATRSTSFGGMPAPHVSLPLCTEPDRYDDWKCDEKERAANLYFATTDSEIRSIAEGAVRDVAQLRARNPQADIFWPAYVRVLANDGAEVLGSVAVSIGSTSVEQGDDGRVAWWISTKKIRWPTELPRNREAALYSLVLYVPFPQYGQSPVEALSADMITVKWP